jgi:hypothetical protein
MTQSELAGDLLVSVMEATARRLEPEIARLKKELEEAKARELPSEWRDITPADPWKGASLWRERYNRLRAAVDPIVAAATHPHTPEQVTVGRFVLDTIVEACKDPEASDDQVA